MFVQFKRIILLGLIVLLAGCAARKTIVPQDVTLKVSGEYLLQSGDIVELVFFQRPELSGEYRVGPDGNIGLPLAGNVKISGLDRNTAELHLLEALSRHYEPVSILLKVKTYRSNEFFSVVGAVNKPGAYPIRNQLNLLTALGMAEGMTREANKTKITLIRNGESKGVYNINMNDILKDGDFRGNVIIQQDDVIYVPETRTASVTGNLLKLQPFLQFALLGFATWKAVGN